MSETKARVPAEVFPPGAFLRDELDARGWSVVAFCDRVDWPAWQASAVLDGTGSITAQLARDLERVLGVSADCWLALQRAWKLWAASAGA